METQLHNEWLSARFSHKGAELISLKNQNSGREYIWEANPDFWGKHAPVLFPIVGALKDGQYRYKNQTYFLPRHGFARDMSFDVLEQNESSVTFSLKAGSLTKKNYPFDFELHIRYTLDHNKLVVVYTVSNNEQDPMPFSIGGHPAFALPEAFSAYKLHFNADESLNSFVLEHDLLSHNSFDIPLKGRMLPLTYDLFANDALIFKTLDSEKISIFEGNSAILHFHIGDFKNFGIWTKTNAPFICLEPWLGYSDLTTADGDIEHKEGILFTEAGKSANYSYTIEITM